VFACLAVFAGGFSAEAAEEVCEADLDTLQSLVEQSLLRREGERLMMLETIREYALEQLEASGAVDQISRRRAEWISALGLQFERDLGTPRLQSALPQLRAEIDNARAAVAWALEHTEPEFVLRLILASWTFGPSIDEVARWYDEALPSAAAPTTPTLAHAFRDAGAVAEARAEWVKADALLLRSLSMHQELGDGDGQTRALRRLGENALEMGDLGRGRTFLDMSLTLATRRGDSRGTYLARARLGRLEHMLNDSQRATEMLEASLALARAEGDLFSAGEMLHELGDLAVDQRALTRAQASYREAAAIASLIGHDHLLAYCLAGLAAAAALRQDAERAGRLWAALGALEKSAGPCLSAQDRARYEQLVTTGVANEPSAFDGAVAAAQDLASEDARRLAIMDEKPSERQEERHITEPGMDRSLRD
jgi:tetratricopeptide (TPR) repeat protein